MLMEIMKHCAHTKYAPDTLNVFGRNFERSKFEDFEPPKSMSLWWQFNHLFFFPAAVPRVPCPDCDALLNCVWGRESPDKHSCMIRSYPNYNFTVHCSVVRYFIFIWLSYLHDEMCDKYDTTCSQLSHKRNDNFLF